ncbi:MAG TPA: proton-conducting transporter membrane subunit, partial [Aggregatilineales bacterium]|nr:proton-conducting transporter membrane subunit [Aggregatilineales bacterium]
MELPTLDTLNLAATVPIVFLTGWALLLLVVDLFIPASRKHWSGWLAILGLVAAGVGLVLQTTNVLGPELPAEAFFGMAVVDGFAVYAQIIVVVAAIFGILLALEYLPKRRLSRGEYYTLLLFSTIGMMLMSVASDLILIFVALELLSIPLYILTGFDRYRTTSEEGAMKYFLLGAFSSAFLVYGVALTYGGTGTTALTGVLAALGGDAPSLPLAIAGVGLVVVGLGFKVAAVPFHMWTPDVYEGAPTPV